MPKAASKAKEYFSSVINIPLVLKLVVVIIAIMLLVASICPGLIESIRIETQLLRLVITFGEMSSVRISNLPLGMLYFLVLSVITIIAIMFTILFAKEIEFKS